MIIMIAVRIIINDSNVDDYDYDDDNEIFV